MPTRHLVNRACVKLGIPYVFGAAIALEGNLSVFNPPETGCLECLMPNKSGAAAKPVTPWHYWRNSGYHRQPTSPGNHQAPHRSRSTVEGQTAGLRLQ